MCKESGKPDETYYKEGDACEMGVGIHLQTCLFYIRGGSSTCKDFTILLYVLFSCSIFGGCLRIRHQRLVPRPHGSVLVIINTRKRRISQFLSGPQKEALQNFLSTRICKSIYRDYIARYCKYVRVRKSSNYKGLAELQLLVGCIPSLCRVYGLKVQGRVGGSRNEMKGRS